MIPLENNKNILRLEDLNAEQYEMSSINTDSKVSLFDINDIKIEEEIIYCGFKQETDDEVLLNGDTNYVNSIPLKHCIKDEKIEFCESPTEKNVKTEVHGNRANEEIKIKDTIANNSIKFERKLLTCDHCNEDYQDYCVKCRMLIHILNENTLSYLDNRTIREIPSNFLELRESFGHCGVYSLRRIPVGVKFGPFTGLKSSAGFWKIQGGRFVVDDDKLRVLNWMQFVNPAQNILEHNLAVFQHEDLIYYRTIHEIQEGEELLVYFGGKYEISLINDVKVDFISIRETNTTDVFACTFCCLGFNSLEYLSKHKTVCPNDTSEDSSNKDITQCLHCNIYLEQWEHLEYHMPHCRDQNDRQFILSTLNDRMLASTTQNELYQGAVKDNTISYCESRPHSCSICCKRFKHKRNLKLHMANVHGRSEIHRCFLCEYETNTKSDLKVHFESSHTKEGKYACTKCAFQTKHKNYLKEHFDTHETVKRLRCTQCDYATNNKSKLKKHAYTHGTQRFTCSECDYKTNFKTAFQRHSETHETEKRFKCSLCDYATNVSTNLRIHFDTHATVKRFKCSLCDYVSKHRSNLSKHVRDHHTIGRFKCSQCDYATVRKQHLKWHTSTHETVKRFKCSQCDYATNFNYDLRKHFDTHLTVKRLKCSKCDYATNIKSRLTNHSHIHETTKGLKCSK